MTSNDCLWRPDRERVAATQIARYAAGKGLTGDDAIPRLWRWSCDHAPEFWHDVWELGRVRGELGAGPIIERGDAMPGARFFPQARLNYAQNLLRRDDASPAIIFRGEDGARRELSWAELQAQVARLAGAMRAQGIGVGDRVAGLLPNLPETVIAMLATTALGAVWSSCSPDFGPRGVQDRFGQIEPRLLVTVDGYRYAGKALDIRAKVAAIQAKLPTLERTVVVPFLSERPDLAGMDATSLWDDYLAPSPEPIPFALMPFDHPAFVLYSSGTTGTPKAIVHGAGGTLLQHLKEHRLHTDLRPGERLFYYTTCGWMMWNWLVSGLASEATLVLFDGSPSHPGPETLWRIAEEERLAVLGTSAKYIDAVRNAGLAPKERFDLSSLRAILSTGSPLMAESFDFVYAAIKDDVQLASISGGTDIVSCFVLGNPAGPVHRGEIQMRGLGLAVEVWDDDGRSVTGQKGELVCTRPFPCMPVGFWNDPDGARYRAAYFERFPGIWCHGDYAELTHHEGVVIHGRSDAVLNPGGVRIGTAEIYRQVEQVPDVLEAICVGQEWRGDVRVVLFVRLRDKIALDDALQQRIRQRIREHTTPRHVPARIVQVADIPRTLSGKITELAVRDVIHGRKVKNSEALANPQALDLYRDLPELAS